MSAAAQAVWDMLPQETRGAVLEVCRMANSRDPKAAAAAAAVKAVEDFYRDKTVTLPCRVKLSALPDGRCELTADFLAAANDHVNLRIRIRKTVTGQEASALEKLAGTAAPRLQITFSEAVNAWVRYGPQDASLTLEEVSNTPATSDRRRDLRFLGPDGSVLAGLDTQGQIAQAPEPAVVASQPEAPRQVEASKQPDVSRQPPTTAPSSLAANVADGGRQAEAEPAQDRRAVPEGVKSGEAARRDAEAGRRADEAARRDAEAARAPKAPKQAKVGKAPKAPAAPPAPPPPQPVRPGADLAVRADSRRGRPPASAPEAGDLDQREADAARGIWEMLPQDLRKRAADATAGNADPRKPPTPEMTAVYREIPGFYLGKTLTMPCQATLRTIGVRGDRGYFTAEMNADAGPQVRVQFRIHRICDAQEIESLTALAARKDLLLQVTPTRTVGASALACRLTRLNDQPGVILIEQWAGSQWPEEALILGPDGTILAGPRKGQKVAVPGARPAAVEPARTGK